MLKIIYYYFKFKYNHWRWNKKLNKARKAVKTLQNL